MIKTFTCDTVINKYRLNYKSQLLQKPKSLIVLLSRSSINIPSGLSERKCRMIKPGFLNFFLKRCP